MSSLNYNEPDSAASVEDALNNNPSLSDPTKQAINSVLGLDPSDPTQTVVVGSWTGTGAVTQPEGQQTQMVVVDIDQPFGSTVNVVIPQENLQSTSVWVFDTDANINVVFNTVERVIVLDNGNDTSMVLGDRNTTIDGGDGNDVLSLSGGNDSITGANGNDFVVAGAGADTIVSGVGYDTVDGGLGFDVLQLEGDVNDWDVQTTNSLVTITGADGNAVDMTNVNFISFGTSIVQNGDQNSIVVTDDASNKDDAMRLYQTALDRSADQAGAQYWLDQIDAGVDTFFVTAESFLLSAEYQEKYGEQTDEEFINQMYQNAFNRDADEAGMEYWLGDLEAGASRAQVLANIAASSEAETSITNVVVVTDIV